MMMKKLCKAVQYMALFLLLLMLPAGCAAEDTVSFSAEIEEVTENSILVTTIDFQDFDRASVDLREAEYDFEPKAGQLVEITIRSEIRESDPVQVTAIKLVLKGEAEKKAADYFPIKGNMKYVYEGKGNEYAAYEVFVEYTSEDRIQHRLDNGGTVVARVYEVKDGKVTMLLSKGEVYYRENMLQQSDGTEEVLLMEPLEKGTSWTLQDGSQRTITGVMSEVKTPLGSFSCIEVVTETNDSAIIDYYAKDIGLVKSIFQSGGMEVGSTLKSIEEDAVRAEMIRFYYPDIESGKIYYQEKEATWRTNDSTAETMENTYKGAVDETLGMVLPTGAAIKSLTLDEDNKVRLDLNAAFITDLNAGSAYELMILQCIANTFGNYYNSEEVILTVEGEPYESGHMAFEEGESIPVDLEGITEKSGE